MEAGVDFKATAQEDFKVYSKSYVGIKSDGTIAIDSATGGSWKGGPSLKFEAGGIDLNGPAAAKVTAVNPITQTIMDEVTFKSDTGWTVETDELASIVSRAPTHEPYPYHNKGVDVEIPLEAGKPPPNPSAVPLPAGVEITRKS